MNGVTINGKKPIVSETVHQYGQSGAAAEVAPKAAQVAGEGASDPGTGKKITPAPSTPELNSPAAAAERINTGTTAEEQKKRLAGKMYPSSTGLREYGAGSAL